MIRETFPVGPLGCNCTVLGDETSGEATVIDPGAEIARILSVLAKHSLNLRQIVVTHAHIDHIAGALALKEITSAPILYREADLPLVAMMDQQAEWLGVAMPEVAAPDHSPADAEVLQTGNMHGEILHTPGHTEGSLCVHLPEQGLLLAGDTLFAGSVGRTDLPGGNMRKLVTSIRERLLTLPDHTVVVPGHGRETTIGEERENNPFLA
ncbi:MAG: MBL fold metallo-hydrolase [Janthinobacterium lividum]